MSEYTPEQQAVIDEVKAQIRVDIAERGIPFMERLHREHGPEDKQGQAWWEFVDIRSPYPYLDISDGDNCVVGWYVRKSGIDYDEKRWMSAYLFAVGGGLYDIERWDERATYGITSRWDLACRLEDDGIWISIHSYYNDAWREAITALRNAHTNA